MSFESKQLQEQAAELAAQMVSLRDAVRGENRIMSDEEAAKFDAMDTDRQALIDKAAKVARLEKADEIKEQVEKASFTKNYKTLPSNHVSFDDEVNALRYFLTAGTEDSRVEWEEAAAKVGYRGGNKKHFNLSVKFGSSGVAQGTTSAAIGGALVPTLLANEIDVALKATSAMRQACRTIRTASGAAMTFPTLDDTAESGLRVAENNTLEEVQSMAFSTKTYNAHKYSSRMIKVPTELLQDSAFDVVQYVGEALGTRIGRIQDNEFTLLSSTAGGPVGVLSASGGAGAMSSSPWDTDLKTAITYAELVNMIHTIDPAYRSRPQCGWMFNDTTLKYLKKMVDTQNRPIWVPGVANGEPDTIGGYRYWINTHMASFGTALNKFALFGDFSKFVVRDVLDYELVRMNERFAEMGQVAFVGLLRSDAKLLGPSTCIKYATVGSSTIA